MTTKNDTMHTDSKIEFPGNILENYLTRLCFFYFPYLFLEKKISVLKNYLEGSLFEIRGLLELNTCAYH
jgi:hypothetical protein